MVRRDHPQQDERRGLAPGKDYTARPKRTEPGPANTRLQPWGHKSDVCARSRSCRHPRTDESKMMRPRQQPRSKHDEVRDYSVNCESHSAAWRLIVDNAFHNGPCRIVRKPMNDIVAQQIRSAVEARLRELRPVLAALEQLQSGV